MLRLLSRRAGRGVGVGGKIRHLGLCSAFWVDGV
jgi:hypothetical protein